MTSFLVVFLIVAMALYVVAILVMLPRLRAPPSRSSDDAVRLPPLRSHFLNNDTVLSTRATGALSSAVGAVTSVSVPSRSPAVCEDSFATQLLNQHGATFAFDAKLDGKATAWRFDCDSSGAGGAGGGVPRLAPVTVFTRDRPVQLYVPLANLTKSRLIERAEQEAITRLVSGALMRAYLPASDPFFARPKPFRRCAVIGSSGLLLNSSLGAQIDAHDVVMRFNWPLLAGFEADVGRKTTHMLVNRKSMHASHWPPYASQRVDYAEQNVTVVAMLHFLDEFTEWLHWARRARAPPLLAVSPDFRRLAAKTLLDALRADLRPQIGGGLSDVVASSGLVGALLALAACEHVTLAGFGTSAHSGNGHYWAPAGAVTREWTIHDFDGEQHYFRLLELRRTYPPWLAGDAQPATFDFVQSKGAKVLLDDLLRHVPAQQAIPDPKAAERAFYSGADRADKFQRHRAAQINHPAKKQPPPTRQ